MDEKALQKPKNTLKTGKSEAFQPKSKAPGDPTTAGSRGLPAQTNPKQARQEAVNPSYHVGSAVFGLSLLCGLPSSDRSITRMQEV